MSAPTFRLVVALLLGASFLTFAGLWPLVGLLALGALAIGAVIGVCKGIGALDRWSGEP